MIKTFQADFYDWVPSRRPKVPPCYLLVKTIYFSVADSYNEAKVMSTAFRRVSPQFLDSVWCEVRRVS